MAKNYNIYNINIIYIINIIYFCLHKYKCCLLFGCSFVRLFGFVYNSLIISLIKKKKKNTMFAP